MKLFAGKSGNLAAIFVSSTLFITAVCSSVNASAVHVKKNTSGGQMKIIKGVDPLKWDNGWNTYIGSLATSLRAMGEKISYEDLMGFSGAAFRLQFFLPHGCPSSPDATCGFNCSKPAMEAMGYPEHWDSIGKSAEVDKKRIQKEIVSSIDKGIPVIGFEMNNSEWGIITGYDKGGEELLCRTYFNKTEGDEPAPHFPWLVQFIGEKKTAPDLKMNFKRSLELAVMLSKTDKFENYASGYFAFENWQKFLRDADFFMHLSKEDLNSSTHMNALIYKTLTENRAHAKNYLRNHKDLYKESVSKHLENAADLYEKESNLLNDNRQNAPFTWELKNDMSWSQADRDKEAKILEKALIYEKAAVSEIEKALQEITSESKTYTR